MVVVGGVSFKETNSKALNSLCTCCASGKYSCTPLYALLSSLHVELLNTKKCWFSLKCPKLLCSVVLHFSCEDFKSFLFVWAVECRIWILRAPGLFPTVSVGHLIIDISKREEARAWQVFVYLVGCELVLGHRALLCSEFCLRIRLCAQTHVLVGCCSCLYF